LLVIQNRSLLSNLSSHFKLFLLSSEPAAAEEETDYLVPLPSQSFAAPSGKSSSVNFDTECLRVDKPVRQVTKSLLLDFDPLLFNRNHAVEQKPAAEADVVGAGVVYGVVSKKAKAIAEPIYDAVAEDEEPSDDEDEEPPPPPPRQV
jgi:hypothetical protein